MFRTNAQKRRLIFLAAPAAALAISLAGCSSPAASTAGGSGSSSIAAVIKGLDNPFFQAMQDGITDTASTDGVNVSVQAAADTADTTGQADKLTTLAGQDMGCFIINPISGTNLVQALAPIAAKGTPVVNIDQPLDADAASAAGVTPATYIGTDNEAAGGKAGEFVAGKVAAGAKVAIIGGVAGNVTSAARIDGFKAAASGLEVVQEEAADWKRELALTKATDIIAANPDIAAFFAANDDMGLGIVKAVENAGKTGQIVVVSVDGNKDALESVAAGGLSATVAQYPFAIGQLGVQACEVAVKGGTLPSNVESPTALVTEQNASDAIAKFPQPFEEFTNPLADLLG
ncbi:MULTISPECIES: substrate-binding domain-containing protein [Microbacterium]|jgi:ABC-type sugar transport system substrate-binding protein|uniref:LacI family transcriptional regulator n=1 Tax=Microbacterium testaceum TaxID=2033 RepID=A0A2T7WLF6_MICTE|nr:MULTISPECIES: substrate-binding domain-containing protein [Microbacterium]PTT20714.1 LacI family transcriptional regulator [Microbacterium sp. HMWF026]PVE75424.1 LacI family transcriptional regulator [Microbacterium testaceum]